MSEVCKVEFGRLSVNGTFSVVVPEGTTVGDALGQAGLTINEEKEGIMEKESKDVVDLSDEVNDGDIYVIKPGINSQ